MTRGLVQVSSCLLVVVAAGCSADTVHVADSCPVMGCGGDVVGEWQIQAACLLVDDCPGESGTVSGVFGFGADSYTYEWSIETSGCGFFGERDANGGGSYRAEGNFMYRGAGDEPIYEYCVDGDVLELVDLSDFGGERFTMKRRAGAE